MKPLIIFIGLLVSFNLQAQEVLRLEADEPAGSGTLEQLDWLVGYWAGPGLGGQCDEMWMPAVDNSMSGAFRLLREGQICFH